MELARWNYQACACPAYALLCESVLYRIDIKRELTVHAELVIVLVEAAPLQHPAPADAQTEERKKNFSKKQYFLSPFKQNIILKHMNKYY